MARHASTKVVSNPDQMGLGLPSPRRIPLEFTVSDVRGLASMTDAIVFSVRASGYDSKVVPSLFGFDEGNWSRIVNARDRFFPQDRLNEFMDVMGNEAPLIQLCESRGYDFASMRKHQTETEKKLEAERRENAELRQRLAIQEEFVRKMVGK